MSYAIGPAIVCPMCGRRYGWDRRMRKGSFPCWCGNRLEVPLPEREKSASDRRPSSDESAKEAPAPIAVPELELDPRKDAPEELPLAPEPVAVHGRTVGGNPPSPGMGFHGGGQTLTHPSPSVLGEGSEAQFEPAAAPANVQPVQVANDVLAKYGLPPTARPRYVTEEDDEGSAFTNTVLPVVLLAVGAVLWLGQAGYVSRDPTQSLPKVAALVVLGLVLNVAVTVGGCYIAAVLMSLNFRSIGQMILKLAAIAVFAGAVGSLIIGLDRGAFSITGMIVAWHMVILIYFFCFCIFFPFDLQENLAAVAIVGLMQALALLMIWTT